MQRLLKDCKLLVQLAGRRGVREERLPVVGKAVNSRSWGSCHKGKKCGLHYGDGRTSKGSEQWKGGEAGDKMWFALKSRPAGTCAVGGN